MSTPLRLAKMIAFARFVSVRWSKSENWGDALNPYLIEKIAKKPVRYEEDERCWKYLVIGSILERADRYSIVWGTGLMHAGGSPKAPPYRICAVRGPLSREQLLNQGLQCPAVYGDPALLLPKYFQPRCIAPRATIGLIPHYTDQMHPWIERAREEEGVRVIDVHSKTEAFVEQIASCECILSSSLHGLICADAYGIPNRRMVLLDDERIGGEFKFADYYASLNAAKREAVRPKQGERARDLVAAIEPSSIDIDLDTLLESCPFGAKREDC